jgi:hypothetical protein
MSVRWTNRFWLVSLELTLFLDFLKLLLKMHLAASFAGKKSYFLDLWIKRYGCLKFLGEVWARQACAGANEEELTKHQKFWGQGGGGKEVGGWKNGVPCPMQQDPARPGPATARPTKLGLLFINKKLLSFLIFFVRPLLVARAWASLGGCIYSTPIF